MRHFEYLKIFCLIIFLFLLISCEEEDPGFMNMPEIPNIIEENKGDDNGNLDDEEKGEDNSGLDNEGNNEDKDNEEDNDPTNEPENEGGDENTEKDNEIEDFNPHEEYPLNLPLPEFNSPQAYDYITDCELEDNLNGMVWKYNVLLPPSYNHHPEKTYPVLFLLHGLDGHRGVWVRSMEFDKILDHFYHEYALQEIIVVMPDAENTYYVNNHQDNIRYEDYFIQIFLPFIQSEYRITSGYKSYMIAGYSMGGYGCAYYALKYKDSFGFCYSISAPLDGKGKSASMPSLFGYFYTYSNDEMPKFIFDVGIDDSFATSNLNADYVLDNRGLRHEFILREGNHNVKFWKEALYIMLQRMEMYL